MSAEILRRIYDDFRDVDREGGVSWSETGVMDGYGSDLERAVARASDSDVHWTEFIEDPKWRPDAGWGGWSFLDAIGFRYYLPAAMVRCLRERADVGIVFHLTLTEEWNFEAFNQKLREQIYYRNQSHDHRLEQWSMLVPRQRGCIKLFMLEMSETANWGRDQWENALLSYWLEQPD